ncbi:MAG: FolB domain-containing protein [Candidatus Promineifilaceae bacterium]|jgi:D-erythro-7,8-dihydroneopterin triphosphate epimerase
MDKIYVRDLEITCIVGANPRERVEAQTVLLNLVLECDFTVPCRSDNLVDTIDYKVIKDQIVEELTPTRYILIERMADHVASLCLRDTRVTRVTVSVDKPGALTGARSVAVEIAREQNDSRLSGL